MALSASGGILQSYQTGDRPVSLLCSDGYHYICKYKVPGQPAHKLAYELIGSTFAKHWGIATPPTAFIANGPSIWDGSIISHDPVAPLFGSRRLDNVFDLSNINFSQVVKTKSSLLQLCEIALFDFWIANEDRTNNNYNLLYDLKHKKIVSIDYGGIFNSGILGAPLYQLNDSDSILVSDLADYLKEVEIESSLGILYSRYKNGVDKSRTFLKDLLSNFPQTWNVDVELVSAKLHELFSREWFDQTWANFNNII